jgi:hypothetical protein
MAQFELRDPDALAEVRVIYEQLAQVFGNGRRADYVMLAAMQLTFYCLKQMGLKSKGIRDTVINTFRDWELDDLAKDRTKVRKD